ncbi:hypothetical protein LP420_36635 [Massilia sp. B-10]|nr:hypothetical protein LP420_36635 [Massilia sp. B-10]
MGFNDNRVTMRSNYWGQGGHNAILVVGDFFKSALDSGKINAAATFPGAVRQAPQLTQEEPEDVLEQGGDMHQDGVPVPEAPPEEVIEDESEGEPKPGDSAPQPEPQPMPQPRPERGERADPVQN